MEFGFRWYSKIGFCWVFHLTHLFRFDISGPQRNAESFEAVRVWPGVRSAHGRQGRADGRASAVGRVTARGDALPPVSSPLAHTHRTPHTRTVDCSHPLSVYVWPISVGVRMCTFTDNCQLPQFHYSTPSTVLRLRSRFRVSRNCCPYTQYIRFWNKISIMKMIQLF